MRKPPRTKPVPLHGIAAAIEKSMAPARRPPKTGSILSRPPDKLKRNDPTHDYDGYLPTDDERRSAIRHVGSPRPRRGL